MQSLLKSRCKVEGHRRNYTTTPGCSKVVPDHPKITSGNHMPWWLKSAKVPKFESLNGNLTTNVCIVGGGIAGLTSAYLLSLKGKAVTLLEDGELLRGETGRTTAHLMSAVDDRYFELERKFGLEGSKTMCSAHKAAVDQIENIVRTEKIDCDFARLDGYLFLAAGHKEDLLAKELKAAERAGFQGEVEWVSNVPVAGFKSGPALRFQNQGEFHPVKYLIKLAELAQRNGVKIFTNSHVAEVKGASGHLKRSEVKTRNGSTVTADQVIVATNVPVNDRFTMYTKLEPYRSYVVTAKIAKGAIPRALYWDTGDPYHYVRTTPYDDAHDLLISGGEDHMVGHNFDFDERYKRLFDWTKERFPILDGIVDKWSGQIIEPVDDVAYIGRNPGEENVFIVTGDSGTGMTHGTIAAMMFTDIITGKKNPWEGLFDPSRKPYTEKKEFVSHNLEVGAVYKDWVTKGEVSSPDEVQPGSGAVMRKGVTKVAIYKDPQGKCYEFTAVCPHMKAIVHWNDDEKSWDCPAHGSRFDCYGCVINGPAQSDLSETQTAAEQRAKDEKAHGEQLPLLR